MSAIAAPSIPRSWPSRSVVPSWIAARTTGVAAVTPGTALSAPPRSAAGTALRWPGSRRTSAPAAYAAWSPWLRVHVAACADANVPSAAARIRRSAARVYRSGRRAICRPASAGTRPRPRASRRSASSASRGMRRIAITAPARRPMAGAATSSGSTPSAPRALRVIGAPYSRSCASAMPATSTRTRSRPRRCGSVRPTWRPTAARTPEMLTVVATVGIVSATSATTPPMMETANVAGPGSGASRPTPSSAGLRRTASTSSEASHGAAITAGTVISSASPADIERRCPNPPPRARSSAVSVRRRSSSRAATSTIA